MAASIGVLWDIQKSRCGGTSNRDARISWWLLLHILRMNNIATINPADMETWIYEMDQKGSLVVFKILDEEFSKEVYS